MWIGSDLVVHRQEVSHELEPLNYLIDPPPILSGSPAQGADIQGLRASHKLIHPRSRRPSLIGLLGGLIGALINWTGLGTLGSMRPILLL